MTVRPAKSMVMSGEAVDRPQAIHRSLHSRVGTDTVGYGVQVVFIPSGAVSLWFFSCMKNQQLLCGGPGRR